MTTHHEHKEYMTVESCKEARVIKRWFVGLIFTLMTIFVVMVGYSITSTTSAANDATNRSVEMQGKFDIHEAKELEADKHVLESISELKLSMKEVLSEVKVINSRLPKNGLTK